jgi:hypothetical protein
MNAKGLRKKLKNGLVVDKWDLVNIIEQQEKTIKELKEKITGLTAVNEEYHSGVVVEDWRRTREYCS